VSHDRATSDLIMCASCFWQPIQEVGLKVCGFHATLDLVPKLPFLASTLDSINGHDCPEDLCVCRHRVVSGDAHIM